MQPKDERKKMFCPMIKEMCVSGHCKSMGTNEDGLPNICRFWTTVKGKDPQSETLFDQGDCAMAWGPILQIENSQMQRQTAADVESFRNLFFKVLPAHVRQQIQSPNPIKPGLLGEGKNSGDGSDN